jgi:uncharacterized protein (TIGR02246 family)
VSVRSECAACGQTWDMTDYEATADQGVRPTDDQELKTLFQRLCQAWTDGNAAAYGACFTPDCDYVSFDGTRAHGREQVVEPHDKLFRGVLFGTALVGDVESIRYIADDDSMPARLARGLVVLATRANVGWAAKDPSRRTSKIRIGEPE